MVIKIEFVLVISILVGLYFGIGIAYGVVATWVGKSNDHGEIDNEYESFSDFPLIILESKDNLNKPYFKP